MQIAPVKFLVVAVLLSTVLSPLFPHQARAHALWGNIVSRFAPQGGNSAALAGVAFAYSDGTPAAYIQAEVYAPGDEKVEYQNGRTDQNGIVAFAPNRNGTWRVTAFDTMGHKAEISVAVGSGETAGGAGQASSSVESESSSGTLLKGVLGVSLLYNFWLTLGLWKRRAGGRVA